MSELTLDEAIKHCLEVAEQNEAKAQKIGVQFLGTTKDREATECRECAADHRQLAEWLTELKQWRRVYGVCPSCEMCIPECKEGYDEQIKELEAKHWDECRQIAHYDNDVKHLCLIIQDRISYVTDYGKGILEGKYSDSYDYNKGYCTALNDILDMIHEITGTEEG